ncbi:MAG: hypothetical protein V4596_05455 [Bdellovibrionota bacterium]
MFKSAFIFAILFVMAVIGTQADAATKYYRWTNQYGLSDSLQPILTQLNQTSNLNLVYADFKNAEHRDLAKYRFTTFLQMYEGIPVKGAMIRTWVDNKTGSLIQMEAHLEAPADRELRTLTLKTKKVGGTVILGMNFKTLTKNLDTMKYVREVVLKNIDDKTIGKIDTRDQWDGNDLQAVIQVTGKRGVHTIIVSHFSKKIVSNSYKPFPNADIAALVYPIYEESEGDLKPQERVPVTLKNILNVRKQVSSDPYAALRNRSYLYDLHDTNLAETSEGQAQGYWSFAWLVRAGKALFEALPWEENSYANKGIYLEGRYATISLHPSIAKVQGLKFPLAYSGHMNFMESETMVNGKSVWGVTPGSAYRGQLLSDSSSALLRPATRLKDHNFVQYINEGFDEIQVYYAVDRLMESLHSMGFTDPELSTRPFHAMLYDTDISMKDNAYYWNDTINFTTYSPDAQNYARDNSTIWHELGHGVMDRLMGEMITLADTGGLSEGMADFVAKLVVEDVTDNQPFEGEDKFRIINQIGFSLTNEVHDDGEAYGGSMRDIMEAAVAKDAQNGLKKMTDLTLDAMRLTRNHPGLTANDWFEHMVFADSLGSPGIRAPGEMRELILSSIALRNFNLDNSPTADFKIVVDGKDVLTGESFGSRPKPYFVELKADQTSEHQLDMSLHSTANYKFKYPLKVEVSFNNGPLQGAVRWLDEAAGVKTFTLNSEAEKVSLKVGATGACDFVNRDDGSCSDFLYILVTNAGETKPSAKKRFYMRVKPLL